MTEEKIDRGSALKRTAELRAAIIAGLQDGQLYRMDMMRDLGVVKALGAKPKDLQNTVYRMVKMGLLEQQPLGTGLGYKLATNSGVRKYPLAKKSEAPSTKPVAAKGNPTIQVDVIKSTGRVRLTLGGLIIEVGVSNE